MNNVTKDNITSNSVLTTLKQLIQPDESYLYSFDDQGTFAAGCISQLNGKDLNVYPMLKIEYNQITQVGALALIKKMNLISFIYEENPIEIEYVSALEDGILNNRKTYLGIYYFANGKKNQLSPEICYLNNSFLVPELTQMRFIALSKVSIFAQPASRALSYENSQSLKRVCLENSPL